MGYRLELVFSSAALACNSLWGLLIKAVFMKANKYTFYNYIITLSLAITSLNYLCFLQSPFFLYKQKNVSKLYEYLTTMCKRNFLA